MGALSPKYVLLLLGGLPLIALSLLPAGFIVEGLCSIALAVLLKRERIPLPQYRAAALTIEADPVRYTERLNQYVAAFYVAGTVCLFVGLVWLII